MTRHSRGAFRPSFVCTWSLENRGRRESRMLAAPAASRAVERSTRVSPPQVQPERPGLPCANGFNGVLRDLPGVHDLLVTVAGRSSPADLAPAKGCQDHTSSSVRKKRRSSREALRPSHPASTSVTTRTPLWSRQDGGRCARLPIFGKRNFFTSELDDPKRPESVAKS